MTANKVLEPASSETEAVCERIQSESVLKKVQQLSEELFTAQFLANGTIQVIFTFTRQRSILSAYSWRRKTTKEAKAIRVKQNGNQTSASSKQWTPPFTRVLR